MTYSVSKARTNKFDNMMNIITKSEGEKADKTGYDLFGDITKYRNGYGVLYLINLLKDVWSRLSGSDWRKERKNAIIAFAIKKFDGIFENDVNSDKENLIAHIRTKMRSIASKTESNEQYSEEDEFYMCLIKKHISWFGEEGKNLILNIQLYINQSEEVKDELTNKKYHVDKNKFFSV